MTKMTDTVNVRERVEAFLDEWPNRSGNGNIIYSLGLDDGYCELTVSDLRALLAAAPKVEQEPVAWVRAVGLLREAESRARPDTSARIKEFLYDLETGDLEVFSAPHPAPASDELLEALEPEFLKACAAAVADEYPATSQSLHYYALKQSDLIAKHKGPQS